MVAIIFEDKAETPSSQLLTSLSIGCNLYFSEGKDNLVEKIEEVKGYNRYSCIVVYIDLVLNNTDTVVTYKQLQTVRAQNEWKDVIIVPIVCFEYYIIKVLYANKWLDTRGFGSVLSNIICKNDFTVVRSEYNNLSYERLIKSKLKACKSRCQCNKNKDGDYIIGKFYKSDCNCESKYCGVCCNNLTLKEKAVKLYTALPVYSIDDRTQNLLPIYDIKHKDIDLLETQKDIQQFFNKIASDLELLEEDRVRINLLY